MLEESPTPRDFEPDESVKNADFVVACLTSHSKIIVIDLRKDIEAEKQFAVLPLSNALSSVEIKGLNQDAVNQRYPNRDSILKIRETVFNHLGLKADFGQYRTNLNISNLFFTSGEFQRVWYQVGKVVEMRGMDMERFDEISRKLLFENRLGDIN